MITDIVLEIEVKKDRVELLGAYDADPPPGNTLSRPPAITVKTWREVPLGAGEIVASFHAANGSLMESRAQPSRHLIFCDIPGGGGSRRYRGGPHLPHRDIRCFHLSLPAGATWLAFSRTEVRPPTTPGGKGSKASDPTDSIGIVSTDREYALLLLGVFPLGHPPLSHRPANLAWPIPGVSAQVPVSARSFFSDFEPGKRPDWKGRLLRVIEYSRSGETAPTGGRPFRIAITGDGFTTRPVTCGPNGPTRAWTDMEIYQKTAALLAHSILDTEPFRASRELLEITSYSVASQDSGISDCPDLGTHRDTAFGCRGHWDDVQGVDEPYYHIGTPLVAYLDPALFPVQVPVPDLIIMLVNSGRGTIIAGNADILHRVAYITVGDLIDTDPADSLSWDPLQSPLCSGFLETALHESGHAIAALADEDIRCLPYDGWKHPNMVWIPDWQNPPPVPWVNLAQQGELLSSGHLRAVQSLDGQCRVPTASSPSEHNTPVYTSEAAGELRWRFPNLGLYWGCLYIDAGTPGGLASLAGSCSIFDDVKGLHFYRGQVLCRMRIMGQPFCRVCSDAIARRILSPDDPWEYP